MQTPERKFTDIEPDHTPVTTSDPRTQVGTLKVYEDHTYTTADAARRIESIAELAAPMGFHARTYTDGAAANMVGLKAAMLANRLGGDVDRSQLKATIDAKRIMEDGGYVLSIVQHPVNYRDDPENAKKLALAVRLTDAVWELPSHPEGTKFESIPEHDPADDLQMMTGLDRHRAA